MTTSTSAEEILKQQPKEAWTQTSGAAAPWQIFASSNVAFVAAPDVGTVPLDTIFPVVIEIDSLRDVQEPKLDKQPAKEQLPLFGPDEDPLPHALLNLLTYSPEPDGPTDEDVRPELGYRFPE